MKHIFYVGDRVRDSRGPSRKGVVTNTDIEDHSDGSESYDPHCGNWSDWPYQIEWDGTGLSWVESEYAEPDGWHLNGYPVQDEYGAQEGTAVADVWTEGTKAYFVSSNKPVVDLEPGDKVDLTPFIVGAPTFSAAGADPINPDYYKFPSGAEVIDISEHLTSNGGQVVQYVARSTRLDGRNKGDVLENLRKARWFLDREISRLEDSDA